MTREDESGGAPELFLGHMLRKMVAVSQTTSSLLAYAHQSPMRLRSGIRRQG